jgi:hypothetical protein
VQRQRSAGEQYYIEREQWDEGGQGFSRLVSAGVRASQAAGTIVTQRLTFAG